MDLDAHGGNKRVFQRLGGGGGGPSTVDTRQKVCYHWRAGKCNRFPCPYLHRELPFPAAAAAAASSNGAPTKRFTGGSTWGRVGNNNNGSSSSNHNRVIRKTDKVCSYWIQGKCGYGDKCKFLHSWSLGDGFRLLTQLEGHQKSVSGIALPSGSDKLYTGSKDETVRVWDCASGQAWNTQTNTDLSLTGPVGHVYALAVGNDLLFAGTQDGAILAWKFNAATNGFEPAASLAGHNMSVVSLVVGANRLYSGSMDHSIRVWNLENLQCIQILTEHTSVVMSLLCWEQFLLSCSLDQTIKVWVATESGNLEVTYTHEEEHGVLTLCGMPDSEAKPVLLSACNDNAVRFYDLPAFTERGKIFAKQEIRSIQLGPGGLFFTGDGTGQVKVWQWSKEPTSASF
ncbi:hypothetical protein Dsin_014782 [Dipteronia sinensis]|uniref:C3H1-type domain-containing protein n=1 Tax=Dipteronia sinensis TaxID=43782 RepID=A0AAE0ANT8_9ROSI|nr:hypothetical protein Dsin_014782 [Dipteronia sinensis]